MVGTNCRIKLFRLVKPGHTALRTARGRQSRKYRDAQVRQVRKDEKPPPTVPDPLPGLLNVALEQIADSILFFYPVKVFGAIVEADNGLGTGGNAQKN